MALSSRQEQGPLDVRQSTSSNITLHRHALYIKSCFCTEQTNHSGWPNGQLGVELSAR